MAVDLNMDMGELIKGMLNKNKDKSENDEASVNETTDNSGSSLSNKIMPFKNIIIIFIIIGASAGAYYKLHYQKIIAENLEKQEEIARLQTLEKEAKSLEAKINTMKKQLDSSNEEYLESLSHFGNSEDLGELYQSISILAEKYDLKVLNIKELPKPPPAAEPLNSKGTKRTRRSRSNATEVTEVKVKVELKGPYIQYIKFKEDLAVAEMLLKINEETVKVKQDEVGKIYAQLNLTTYAIDKKPFQKVISVGQIENNEDK
jgi:Tfp pilus assembly protein PilO